MKSNVSPLPSNADRVLETYLVHCRCEKRLDEKTVKAYRCDLGQFLAWTASRQLVWSEVMKGDVSAYIAHLNGSFAPASAKRKVASVRAFYAYCEDEGLVAMTPFYGLKVSIREPKRLPRTIPLADLSRMFEQGADVARDSVYERFRHARDRAIIEVLIATGVRVSELCGLDDQDFDPVAKTLLIFGKGAKERIIQVESGCTLDALERYRVCRDAWLSACSAAAGVVASPEGRAALFVNRFGNRMAEQSVRAVITAIADRASASTHITPHMFRHTFATLLLEEDVDIRYIQRLLGHSSIKTTEIYTHVTSTKLRSILRDHNPRNAIGKE